MEELLYQIIHDTVASTQKVGQHVEQIAAASKEMFQIQRDILKSQTETGGAVQTLRQDLERVRAVVEDALHRYVDQLENLAGNMANLTAAIGTIELKCPAREMNLTTLKHYRLGLMAQFFVILVLLGVITKKPLVEMFLSFVKGLGLGG